MCDKLCNALLEFAALNLMEDIVLVFFKNADDLLDQLFIVSCKTLESVLQTCNVVESFDELVVAIIESFVPDVFFFGVIFEIDKTWWDGFC